MRAGEHSTTNIQRPASKGRDGNGKDGGRDGSNHGIHGTHESEGRKGSGRAGGARMAGRGMGNIQHPTFNAQRGRDEMGIARMGSGGRGWMAGESRTGGKSGGGPPQSKTLARWRGGLGTFNMQHSTANVEGKRRELREVSRIGKERRNGGTPALPLNLCVENIEKLKKGGMRLGITTPHP